jgi:glycosyltransferase involved in cell wall biosynthesis
MGADICALLHSDGQYAPELLRQLLEPLANDEADLVMGSRMLEKGKALQGGMPLYKYFANIILTFVENTVYGLKMSEYHSGYMLYKRNILEKVAYQKLSDKFHFDGEMLMISAKKGFRIKEISIPTLYADEEKTLNPITYGFEVLSIIVRYILGKYEV